MQQLTLAQAFARAAPKKKEIAPAKKKEPTPVKTSPKKAATKILFGQNGPHADFNQFSLHAVMYQGSVYPTCQHLFQSFKVAHAVLRCTLSAEPRLKKIRTAPSAEAAFGIAHHNKASVRSDWFSINTSKFFICTNALSDNTVTRQDSMTDSFWGVGADLLGCNELGQALERVRERLGGAKAPLRTVLQCQCLRCAQGMASNADDDHELATLNIVATLVGKPLRLKAIIFSLYYCAVVVLFQGVMRWVH
ncbi:hypothetical protein B0H10DRAFT_1968834 [Mycena sp. CBHHK59/15]|nr:hypothetical protein B0H10DRAFT_1968834 [Mycena sp. CBHHK59/15]